MTKFHISVALPGKRITDHTTSFKKKKKKSVSGTHCKFSGDQSGSKTCKENLA